MNRSVRASGGLVRGPNSPVEIRWSGCDRSRCPLRQARRAIGGSSAVRERVVCRCVVTVDPMPVAMAFVADTSPSDIRPARPAHFDERWVPATGLARYLKLPTGPGWHDLRTCGRFRSDRLVDAPDPPWRLPFLRNGQRLGPACALLSCGVVRRGVCNGGHPHDAEQIVSFKPNS